MAGLAAARMSCGSEFHAAGLACEKARSPNLVRSRGVTYLLLEADRRPVPVPVHWLPYCGYSNNETKSHKLLNNNY